MIRVRTPVFLKSLVVVLSASVFPAAAVDLTEGAVYLMTNQGNNAIIAFERAPLGTLTRVGRYLTGGVGNPVPQGSDPPADPLASQGSLVLSDDGRFLFAVNAGSNEISVLAVQPESLELVGTVGSGGVRPISVTAHGNLLYVLNEGGTSPNIVGFRIGSTGELTRIANSRRSLPSGVMADPGHIAFNPTGRTLVLTEKATDQVVSYRVRLDGRTEQPVVTPSNAPTPFGIAFDGLGHMFVAEAAGGIDGIASLSSYEFLPGGVLQNISESVPDLQTFAGRVVVTLDKQFVYVSNRRSSQISAYQLSADGSIALLHSAAFAMGPNGRPIDMALSRDGQNLYVHLGNRLAIRVFEINPDGTLNARTSVFDLPSGAQGIAAF
jgi:6-phosphogluconolactonase (cycloisomerase 2 family)